MDTTTKLHIINAVKDFPIGDKCTTREELIAKASIIIYLANKMRSEFFGNSELVDLTRKTMLEALTLENGEALMNEMEASRILKLSNGFIQDYGKVEYIRENNPSFDKVYDLLIAVASENLTTGRSL